MNNEERKTLQLLHMKMLLNVRWQMCDFTFLCTGVGRTIFALQSNPSCVRL